jgi:phosphoglycolate phosphatase-like HAD superfamily hydrolase
MSNHRFNAPDEAGTHAMIPYEALVFDFDGVLADSVEVKTHAFEALYLPHGPQVAAEVVRYHREHGGVTRREKFRHFEAALLSRPADEARLDELCEAFSRLVLAGVIAAQEIPGATAFLRHWHGRMPLYVNSATPDAELMLILKRRGLDGLFVAAYGSDRTKAENLAAILAQGGHAPEKTLFFGDAVSDYSAARECGVPFLGIVRSTDSVLLRVDPTPRHCADFLEVQARLNGEMT